MAMNTRVLAPFRGRHDHSRCLAQALDDASRVCESQGLRFTPLRRQTLELVWGSHKPVGAYEVLDGLKKQGYRPAPPTAYRALEFLHKAGLIHRIESLNAYIGCAAPRTAHAGQFLICDKCASVAEVHDPALVHQVGSLAESVGFSPADQMIEVHGLCSRCRAQS